MIDEVTDLATIMKFYILEVGVEGEALYKMMKADMEALNDTCTTTNKRSNFELLSEVSEKDN
jgi:hypothetical protein